MQLLGKTLYNLVAKVLNDVCGVCTKSKRGFNYPGDRDVIRASRAYQNICFIISCSVNGYSNCVPNGC